MARGPTILPDVVSAEIKEIENNIVFKFHGRHSKSRSFPFKIFGLYIIISQIYLPNINQLVGPVSTAMSTLINFALKHIKRTVCFQISHRSANENLAQLITLAKKMPRVMTLHDEIMKIKNNSF